MTDKKTFSTTRKNSFNLDKLKAKIQKSNNGYDKSDDGTLGFWKLTVDKSDNGEATLRFLPGIMENDDDMPYVERFTHIFKGAGGTFWETCSNTIGVPCPVCAANSELYKQNTTESKALASRRKKQHKYVSNVLVVDDKGNPENNGKVFLFEYGPDLFKQLIGQMDGDIENPNFTQVIPYMLDETGADFKLVSHHEGDYRKYTKSFYKKPAAREVSEELLAMQKPLKDYTNASKVKSEEVIRKRMEKVLKESSSSIEIDDMREEPQEMQKMSAKDEETLDSFDKAVNEEDIDVDEEIKKLLG